MLALIQEVKHVTSKSSGATTLMKAFMPCFASAGALAVSS